MVVCPIRFERRSVPIDQRQSGSKSRKLFQAAQDLEADRRAAFLQEACEGDWELLPEVHRLLETSAAEGSQKGTLDQAVEMIADLAADIPRSEIQAAASKEASELLSSDIATPLPSIDGYRIKDVLGFGGMGIVYRARQMGNLKREVAIKVIKPGMDSVEILKRFQSEQQALASIAHPMPCCTHICLARRRLSVRLTQTSRTESARL